MFHALAQPAILAGAVAISTGMLEAARRVKKFARARTPIVLLGETGTGKSFLAAALHAKSGRPGSLVDVSAGELRPTLAPADIFGHERGAFTGAVCRRRGLLEQAQNGTFLLDDFHLLDPDVQGALLRAIETRRYRPLGAQRDLPLTCGLVFGVGRDLDLLVTEGKLLPDLRYRLGFSLISIPRLEARREEIMPFARLFLARAPEVTDVSDGPSQFAPDVFPVLERATYPGNVRELRGRIETAYLLARGEPDLRTDHLAELDARIPAFPRRGRPRRSARPCNGHSRARVAGSARRQSCSRSAEIPWPP